MLDDEGGRATTSPDSMTSAATRSRRREAGPTSLGAEPRAGRDVIQRSEPPPARTRDPFHASNARRSAVGSVERVQADEEGTTIDASGSTQGRDSSQQRPCPTSSEAWLGRAEERGPAT